MQAVLEVQKDACVGRDIFALTKNPELLSDCITLLVNHIKKHCSDVDVIVGVDARGFIFGSLIAQHMSLPFVPVRKAGKLPGETIQVAYTLEYDEVNNTCLDHTCTHNHLMAFIQVYFNLWRFLGWHFLQADCQDSSIKH